MGLAEGGSGKPPLDTVAADTMAPGGSAYFSWALLHREHPVCWGPGAAIGAFPLWLTAASVSDV